MLAPTGAIRPGCGSMKASLTVLVCANAMPPETSDAHATAATFMESRNILSPLWNNLWRQEYWKLTTPVKQTGHSNQRFSTAGQRLQTIPDLPDSRCAGSLRPWATYGPGTARAALS